MLLETDYKGMQIWKSQLKLRAIYENAALFQVKYQACIFNY